MKELIINMLSVCYAGGNALVSGLWAMIPYYVLTNYGLELKMDSYAIIICMVIVGNFYYNYKNLKNKQRSDK